MTSSVARLKDEGVELFRRKKYKDAIEKFSTAISLDEPGSDDIKALCYNNRAAAKEHAGGFSRPDMMSDVSEAIRLNPQHGKAYARRARLHRQGGQWRDALADLFAAQHLASLSATVAVSELQMNIGHLEEERRGEWLEEIRAAGGIRHVPVAHNKIYRWMHWFGRDNRLLLDVLAFQKQPSGDVSTYSLALQLFDEKQYDDVDTLIIERGERLGDKAAECWTLAARTLAYKAQWKESEECLSRAASLVAALSDARRKHGLTVAAHVIRIEMARDKEGVMRAWRDAVAFSPSTPDFYTHASNRLMSKEAYDESREVIFDERVDKGEIIDLHRYLFDHMFILDHDEFEDEMKQFDYPGLATAHLAFALHPLGPAYVERCCGLLRMLAERDGFSGFWFDLGMRTADAQEAVDCLEKCISIEPFHMPGNMGLVDVRLGAYGDALIPKSECRLLVSCVERALACYEPTMDGHDLRRSIRFHELLTAKLRAAEMVGFD